MLNNFEVSEFEPFSILSTVSLGKNLLNFCDSIFYSDTGSSFTAIDDGLPEEKSSSEERTRGPGSDDSKIV